MSPGTGPYTGTRPGSFGATKGQGGPRRRGYTHRTNVMRIQILSDPHVEFDGNTIPHSPPAPNSSSSPATSLRCTPAGSVTSQGAGPAPTGHSTCQGAGREATPASAPSAERQRNGGSGQLWTNSGALMPWSRMLSDPILSVSPSGKNPTPEIPAPAAPAAPRTRERKAAARTSEQNLRTGTAPQAVAGIAKGNTRGVPELRTRRSPAGRRAEGGSGRASRPSGPPLKRLRA